MKGSPGFIVKVVPNQVEPISYQSSGLIKTLSQDDEFIGYFWQILTERDGAQCHVANITRIIPNNGVSNLYYYADEAWFNVNDIKTIIIALRGPRSNSRFLAKKFRVFETWDIARNGNL